LIERERTAGEMKRAEVMGVVNVTPDSFSDGGHHLDSDRAVERARHLVDAGAAYLDIGGESTRPGAEAVPAQVEL
jgi:dihydropteroate synthase